MDHFDIVSRTAIPSGSLHGKDGGIVPGPNDFDYSARVAQMPIACQYMVGVIEREYR